MLSWSGDAQGVAVELGSLNVGLPGADALIEFARAATSPAGDAVRLATARERLAESRGHAVMVDASAVVANFEMMTRLADSTGAVLHNPASVRAGEMIGAENFASKR
jgi:hypothetical protein